MAEEMKKAVEGWRPFSDPDWDDYGRSIAQVPAKGKVIP